MKEVYIGPLFAQYFLASSDQGEVSVLPIKNWFVFLFFCYRRNCRWRLFFFLLAFSIWASWLYETFCNFTFSFHLLNCTTHYISIFSNSIHWVSADYPKYLLNSLSEVHRCLSLWTYLTRSVIVSLTTPSVGLCNEN